MAGYESHKQFGDSGCCYHVALCGIQGQAGVAEARHYVAYLGAMMDALLRCGVLLHAYVLMENQVQLLLSTDHADGVSRLIRLLGHRDVNDFSRRYRRADGPWEERFHVRLIPGDEQLLRCYRVIELSPVRNRLVSHPGDCYWSSYACNAAGLANDLITPHPDYLALNPDDSARRSAYRSLFTDAAAAVGTADVLTPGSGLSIWSSSRNCAVALAAAGCGRYSIGPQILERS